MKHSLSRVASTTAVAIVMAMGLVACGGGGSGDVAATSSGSTSTTTSVTSFESVSPAADFMLGPDGAAPFAYAVAELVTDCMTARGWTFENPVPRERSGEPSAPNALMEWRSTYGYGLLSSPPAIDPSSRDAAERQQQYAEGLPLQDQERYWTDLGRGYDDERGGSASGCYGEAEDELRGAYPRFHVELAETISQEVSQIGEHPDFATALSAWRDCMGSAGYDFTNPGQARQAATAEFPNPADDEAARREIAIASADAECAFDTIWPTQARLEREIVQDARAKYGF